MTSLYLTYDGLTDPLGQSQILPYLLGLEERGISFHIISFEKKEVFKKNKDQIEYLIQGKNIHWNPVTYHKSPPVLSTLYDIYLLRKKAFELVKKENINVVHCRSYITSLIGLELKKKLGIKFIFDMRGFWADERIEGNIWNAGNPVFKRIYDYFKKKEKQFFKEADATISLTENAKSYIQQNFDYSHRTSTHSPISSSPHLPIQVIPCCADLNLFNKSNINPQTVKEIESVLSDRSQFKLLYLGSLGTWYMLEEMLDFFEALTNQIPTSQFIILTKDQELLRTEILERGWKQAEEKQLLGESAFRFFHSEMDSAEIIISQAPRKSVPAFISYSDASIMFIKPSFSKKASSATKMGEVFAMGKAVITNSGWGDVELFQKKIEGFYVVDSFSKEEYSTIVKKLIANNNSEENSSFAIEYFSLEKGVDKYFEVYQVLLLTQ